MASSAASGPAATRGVQGELMADRTLIDPLSVLLVSVGRAHAWFTAAGITIERVMTDNGSCYKSFAWRDALATAGITHKRTRPYRG